MDHFALILNTSGEAAVAEEVRGAEEAAPAMAEEDAPEEKPKKKAAKKKA
jgi:hypothetical protein